MAAMPVVVVQPGAQCPRANRGRRIRATIRPLPQQALNEALGLAVRPRRVGPRPQLAHAVALAERGEDVTAVGEGVVGHESAHPNAVAAKPAQGPPDERCGRGGVYVTQDFDIHEPRCIIDRHVDVVPADVPPAVAAIAGNAMADPDDAAEFLDVDVQQIAGMRPLIAAHADWWGQRGQASQPTPLEQPRDGGASELQPRGNLGTRPALPAEAVDPGHEAVRGGRGAPPRATGP